MRGTTLSSTIDLDISRTGTLVYMTGRSDDIRQLAMLSLDGLEEPLGEHTGDFSNPRLSPDGRLVALTVEVEDNEDIKILELERDILRPLTFDPTDDDNPLWSPDGG